MNADEDGHETAKIIIKFLKMSELEILRFLLFKLRHAFTTFVRNINQFHII